MPIDKVEDLSNRLAIECESSAPVRIQISKRTIEEVLDFMNRHELSDTTLSIMHTSEFPIPGNYAATLVVGFINEWERNNGD